MYERAVAGIVWMADMSAIRIITIKVPQIKSYLAGPKSKSNALMLISTMNTSSVLLCIDDANYVG